TGVFQQVYGGATAGSFIMGDAYLSKFDAQGTCLWSTYYGGTLEDRGLDLCLAPDSSAVYLAGSTRSTSGIATPGAHQQTLGGNFDAFLAKFDSSGQREWATYYGGASADGNTYLSTGVVCDLAGNVFLAGATSSTAAISTPG